MIILPNTLTHSYFIMDVYYHLNIRQKELLMDKKDLLKISSQSMDVLFFYDVFKLKDNKIRQLANKFHTSKTGEFLITFINYIRYNKLYYDPDVIAFLYGLLSHYILDTTFHPYINYKCGVYDNLNIDTFKYNGKHLEMESFIDNYFVNKFEHYKPNNYKCFKLFNVDDFSKELIETLDFSFKETYNINHLSKYYLKSLSSMHLFYRLCRYDKFGLKKISYTICDKILPNNFLNIKGFSYHISLKDKHNYLNLNHKIWYDPIYKSKKYTTSIDDLYQISLDKTLELINIVNKYIFNKEDLNLEKYIKNLSYKTGIDCDSEKELKYFEF